MSWLPDYFIKEVSHNKKLLLKILKNSEDISFDQFSKNILNHLKEPIFDIQSKEDKEDLEKLFFANMNNAYLLNNFPQLFVKGKIPLYKLDKEVYLKCIQNSENNRDVHLLNEEKVNIEWFSDFHFLNEVCKIYPTILGWSELREFLNTNPKIRNELLKTNTRYLLYFYDNKESILKEAKKMSADEVEELISENIMLNKEDREVNPVFYRSLEKDLRNILVEKRTQSKIGEGIFFHFE